ncbi:MAG: agmatinase family protein [Dehalococcoidia bacterium]
MPANLVLKAGFEDRYERRIANWIQPWDFVEPIDAALVMVPYSGASIYPSGVHAAPNAIRRVFTYNTTYSPDYDVDIQSLKVRDLGDIGHHITDVALSHQWIREALEALYKLPQQFLMVIVGGDHSISYPSVAAWTGTHPGRKLGIVHFDAHNDVRNLEDGGPTNGTPFRSVLEGGLGVDGRNMVQIGIHGFMNSRFYKEYLLDKGATIFTARQVRRRGMEPIIGEAMEIAGEGTDSIYVSLDIDVLTHTYAIGTPAASPEGLQPHDLLDAIFALGANPKVCALDLVCIDPLVDVRDLTSKMGASIILTFLAGYHVRKNGGGPSPD